MNNLDRQSNRRLRKFGLWCVAVVSASAALANTAVGALIYEVELDTTGQQSVNNLLAFDLVSGDSQAGNNHVRASNFQTDGTLANRSAVLLQDTSFFSEDLRTITFGTFLKFDLALTQNHAPPGVDEFSFFLLNPASQLPSVHTTDPSGADALFAIDINGTSAGVLTVYDPLTENFSWNVTLASAAVPDTGGTGLLLSAAVWLLLHYAGYRQSRDALPARIPSFGSQR